MTGPADPGRAGRQRPGPLARIGHDPEALEAFYTEHVTAVTRFVARRVADPHTVADLTAEVFLAVIDSAHTYRPGRGTQLAWLYGIARNVIAGERRRAAHELRAASRAAGRRLLDDDDIARLEERIDTEGAGRAACLALAGLPPDERAVLELVAVDGLPVTD
ncbi:MAG TPA: RNA polymerase sigma factor, partial [Streptosporangiaceae bacterium]|nr:RNA polymerase sigma factor [Streptosporangiaceae bacterium]